MLAGNTSVWARGAFARVGAAMTEDMVPGSPVVAVTVVDSSSRRATTVSDFCYVCAVCRAFAVLCQWVGVGGQHLGGPHPVLWLLREHSHHELTVIEDAPALPTQASLPSCLFFTRPVGEGCV